MTSLRRSPEKIRLPKGFSFSAVTAGIKVSGRPDLALAEVADGAAAAALFTTNRVVAAPVEVGRAKSPPAATAFEPAKRFVAKPGILLESPLLKFFRLPPASLAFNSRRRRFARSCRN